MPPDEQQLLLDQACARAPSPSMTPDEWNRTRLDREALHCLRVPTWEDARGMHLTAAYNRDLGGNLSTAKRALLQRVVILQVACEVADFRFVAGRGQPGDDYARNSALLLRLLKELGLDAKAKAGTLPQGKGSPQLQALLAKKAAEKAGAAEADNVIDASDYPGWLKPAAGA